MSSDAVVAPTRERLAELAKELGDPCYDSDLCNGLYNSTMKIGELRWLLAQSERVMTAEALLREEANSEPFKRYCLSLTSGGGYKGQPRLSPVEGCDCLNCRRAVFLAPLSQPLTRLPLDDCPGCWWCCAGVRQPTSSPPVDERDQRFYPGETT